MTAPDPLSVTDADRIARLERLILWALDGRTHWPTRGDMLVLREIMPAQAELSADLRALAEERSK